MSAPAPDPRLVGTLGVTLIHFLWQGALIAALLGGTNLALRRAPAHLRYLAACVALLLMFVAPIATFVRVQAAPPSAAEMAWTTTMAPAPSVPSVPTTRSADPKREPLAWQATPQAPHAARTPSPSPDAESTPPPDSPSVSEPIPAALAMPPAVMAAIERWLDAPSPLVLAWLVALWSLGVGILSVRLLGGWVVTQRLRHAASTEVPMALRATLARLALRLQVSRPVRLCQSLLVEVPTVVGWLRPVILLPASTLVGLTPQQLEAVLAHELAHIRRHDYLVNLCQTVVETLLFYHPAVWWVSRQIRDERENCCDDVAVSACGDALVYARALCELEQMRAEAPELAMAATGGSLVQRIRRVLGARSSRSSSPSRWVAGALAMSTVVMVVIAAGYRPVQGRTDQPAAIDATWPPTAPIVASIAVKADPTTPAEANELPYLPEPVTPDVQWVDAPRVSEEARHAIEVITPTTVMLAPMSPHTPLTPMTPVTPMAPMTPFAPLRVLAIDQALLACKDQQQAAKQVLHSQQVLQTLAKSQQVIQNLSREQVEQLAQRGVDDDLVHALAKSGVASMTVDELLELSNHGVDAEFVEGMADAGYPSLSVDDLVQFANHGVTPEYVKGLADAGCTRIPAEDLVRLANSGVTPEWIGAMQFLGYSKLSVDQLILLSTHGVDTDYVSTLRAMGYRNLGVDDLIALASHGVTSDYVAELWGAGLRHLSSDDLIHLRDQGVESALVAALHGVGAAPTAADLIQLAQNGVDADYVLEISSAGLHDLTTNDWVRLKEAGIDSRFVGAVLELRGNTQVSDLVRMKQSGAEPDAAREPRGQGPRRQRERTR